MRDGSLSGDFWEVKIPWLAFFGCGRAWRNDWWQKCVCLAFHTLGCMIRLGNIGFSRSIRETNARDLGARARFVGETGRRYVRKTEGSLVKHEMAAARRRRSMRSERFLLRTVLVLNWPNPIWISSTVEKQFDLFCLNIRWIVRSSERQKIIFSKRQYTCSGCVWFFFQWD